MIELVTSLPMFACDHVDAKVRRSVEEHRTLNLHQAFWCSAFPMLGMPSSRSPSLDARCVRRPSEFRMVLTEWAATSSRVPTSRR